MKRIALLIVIAITILTLGAISAVYAIDNEANKSMIEIMRSNGFEKAADAMENRDYDAMNEFMENITDEQYNQMIEIMRSNGYESMANMMGSFSREEMVNMHKSMMNR